MEAYKVYLIDKKVLKLVAGAFMFIAGAIVFFFGRDIMFAIYGSGDEVTLSRDAFLLTPRVGIYLMIGGGATLIATLKLNFKKPQIELSSNGMYLGMELDQTFKWSSIDRWKIIDEKDENGKVKNYLAIRRVKSSRGVTGYKKERIALEKLNINEIELVDKIKEFKTKYG